MLLDYLKNEFSARSQRNPSYSLRAFARTLRIDSSTLSALLRGKRVLSPKTATKILAELEIDPELKKQLLLSSLGSKNENANGKDLVVLEETTLKVVGGWEHYAILSVLELSKFRGTVRAIASRLNISTATTIAALNRMERLGLVSRTGSTWKGAGKHLTTSHDIPNAELRRQNRQYLEKALYSLEHHDVSDRDITGMTMAISKKKLSEAKRRIASFRRELCRFLESGEKDEVYRLNVQLFPLKK